MQIFIIGVTGAVGGLLADELISRGDNVRGLVRTSGQQRELAKRGIETVIGAIAEMPTIDLTHAVRGADWIVYTAGSNGGSRAITRAIDGDGVLKALDAAHAASVGRFALVSVFPESWRERELDEEVDYYFAVKKEADVAVSRSPLDWLILRPSLLLDSPATGRVSLGPAEFHQDITRADVAATLAELLHQRRVGRQILEVNRGSMPISQAVRSNVRG